MFFVLVSHSKRWYGSFVKLCLRTIYFKEIKGIDEGLTSQTCKIMSKTLTMIWTHTYHHARQISPEVYTCDNPIAE